MHKDEKPGALDLELQNTPAQTDEDIKEVDVEVVPVTAEYEYPEGGWHAWMTVLGGYVDFIVANDYNALKSFETHIYNLVPWYCFARRGSVRVLVSIRTTTRYCSFVRADELTLIICSFL